ncbi:helix-turn-helix domain-containing protein [Sporosarcina gallistercoris]|uniref:helix-turn-helix domain-containing protein n=1 Tax=Sporosarcina gallistercoris TaxID=2762245 RepID=UPI003D2D870E
MEKIVLTVKEVSELLNASTATVYTMVRLNEIPHSRIRAKIVFHRPTLEDWLAKGGVEQKEAVNA